MSILSRSHKEAAIGSLVLAEGGRAGMHGDDGIWAHDSVSAVRPDTGAAQMLKIHVVEKLGYTSGAMGLPDTRPPPGELLVRAVKYWSWKSRDTKTQKIEPVMMETIRDWCKPSGGFGALFKSSWERGAADRAAKRVDHAKKLP
jgi:hypothetical protein